MVDRVITVLGVVLLYGFIFSVFTWKVNFLEVVL